MMSKTLFLLARVAVQPLKKTSLAAVTKTFSSSSTMSLRRPLDENDDETPFNINDRRESETENSFPASEYEGPGEKGINQVTLLGRVGLEPQIRGSEDSPVTTFNLATNSSWRNINPRAGENEWSKRTDWHNVVVFKPGLRELAYNNIVKGSRVHVTGKLMYGEYLDRQGVKRQTTSIVCDDIIFLSQKKGNI